MKKHLKRFMLGLVAGLSMVGTSHAAVTTATFQVRMTIQADCRIVSASDLDFGTSGVISANVDVNSTLNVQCTNTTPYNIGLNAGTGAGATVAARLMTLSGATIQYSLYTTAARATVWGETIGTDTVAAVGNGASQVYTIYGRVPPQTTPAPGLYTDTVTVTVTF